MDLNISHNISHNISLTDEQQDIFRIIKEGSNVLITGPGGTGKTTLISFIVSKMSGNIGVTAIGVTAMTGAAAVLINGRTLHSFLGIGLGKECKEVLTSKIRRSSKLVKRWDNLKILIVDEISMLSEELFEKLNYIAQQIRSDDSPFGGIQLVFCGDFLQLPVIKGEFCFLSDTWKKCNFKVMHLTKIIRQRDEEFQRCLNSARFGNLSEQELKYILEGYEEPYEEPGETDIKPTEILCKNIDVDNVNSQELLKLKSEILEYALEISYNPDVYDPVNHKYLFEDVTKICNAQPLLKLSVGAQVMHLVNKDEIVNGSRGVVVRFEDDLPVVKFKNGLTQTIGFHGYEITEIYDRKTRIIATIYQVPLKLAYAVTVHKSQGMTIDCAIVDLAGVFEYGQAYVALSRVKDVKGLQLFNATTKAFKAHPKALKFYE
jgi:ATP-dependent DNA helicase PIF1